MKSMYVVCHSFCIGLTGVILRYTLIKHVALALFLSELICLYLDSFSSEDLGTVKKKRDKCTDKNS